MTKKRRKEPDSDPDVAELSEMERLVVATKVEVEAQLDIVRLRRKALENPEHLDETLVKLTNSLTKSVAAVSAEQRQLEKHKRTVISQLTPELEDEIIEDFLRDLPRTRRERFVQFLASLEDNNDLLSL